METNHGASEVPLDTMRSPSRVDEIADLEHTRASVLVASNEHPIGIVAELQTIDHLWEAGHLRQVGGIDGVEVVAAVETTRWAGFRKAAILIRIRVGLCCEVPDSSVGIDDTSSCNTNRGIDVNTAVQISGQERYMHVPRCHNISGFCVDLVQIILRSCNINVLYAITESIDERLREDLLRANSLKVAW